MKKKLLNYIVTVTIMVTGILNLNITAVNALSNDKAIVVEQLSEEFIEPNFDNLYTNIYNTINVSEEEKKEQIFKEYHERKAEEARKKREEERKKQALLKSLGLKSEDAIEFKIYQACDKYNVPFDICLATARLETGWFTSDAYLYRNNPGGLSRNEVPLSFSSKDVGVDRFVKNLKENYFDEGLDTPYEIGQKYCPVDPDWANMVSRLMEYPVNYKYN